MDPEPNTIQLESTDLSILNLKTIIFEKSRKYRELRSWVDSTCSRPEKEKMAQGVHRIPSLTPLKFQSQCASTCSWRPCISPLLPTAPGWFSRKKKSVWELQFL